MSHMIEFTDEAMFTIDNMGKECSRLELLLGPDDSRVKDAHASLHKCIRTMLTLRPNRVMADGELSLICNNDHIVFGVNYSGANREFGAGTWTVNS